MKAPLVFALVALVGMAVAEAVVIRRLSARVADLETASAARAESESKTAAALKRAGIDPDNPASAASRASAADPAALDAAVQSRTEKLEQRLAALESGAASGNAGHGNGSASPDQLDAMVARKVDEKLEANGKGKNKGGFFGDDNKRPLADVSKDLGLTELQEDQMKMALDDSQKKVFDLIITPRNDGTNVMDDIVTALRDPDHAQEKATAAFMKLFTDKIPGSDETYLAVIMREKIRVKEDLKKILTEDQAKKFERMAQDPHDIKTGYDPFSEYLVQKMGPDAPK